MAKTKVNSNSKRNQARRNSEKELKESRMIREAKKVSPAFLDDGRLVCPVCMKQDEVKVYNYTTSQRKGKKGVLYSYICNRCEVKFNNHMSFAQI